MPEFEITVWGARGSFPTPGPGTQRYGGNTSCLSLQLDGHTVIFDAGSGVEPLGRKLLTQGRPPVQIFLTHAHYDHVMGLPFFAPLHTPDYPVTLHYAGSPEAPDGAALLDQLIAAPLLPFRPSDFQGALAHAPLPSRDSLPLAPGFTLDTLPVRHPGGSLALKVTGQGRSFVHVPDFEHDDGPMDAELVAFLRGADLAFLDCTYSPEEYPRNRGIGHSHWDRVAELTAQAGVGRWGAFHHAHTRDDAQLDALAAYLTEAHPRGFVVAEGMRLDMTAPDLGLAHR